MKELKEYKPYIIYCKSAMVVHVLFAFFLPYIIAFTNDPNNEVDITVSLFFIFSSAGLWIFGFLMYKLLEDSITKSKLRLICIYMLIPWLIFYFLFNYALISSGIFYTNPRFMGFILSDWFIFSFALNAFIPKDKDGKKIPDDTEED